MDQLKANRDETEKALQGFRDQHDASIARLEQQVKDTRAMVATQKDRSAELDRQHQDLIDQRSRRFTNP